MVGIYSFIEKSTGRRYIGYTNNIDRRKWEHEHKKDTRIPFDSYLLPIYKKKEKRWINNA